MFLYFFHQVTHPASCWSSLWTAITHLPTQLSMHTSNNDNYAPTAIDFVRSFVRLSVRPFAAQVHNDGKRPRRDETEPCSSPLRLSRGMQSCSSTYRKKYRFYFHKHPCSACNTSEVITGSIVRAADNNRPLASICLLGWLLACFGWLMIVDDCVKSDSSESFSEGWCPVILARIHPSTAQQRATAINFFCFLFF